MAVKGVQFKGPWKRRSGRRGKLQLRYWNEVSFVVGHWEIVEDLEAMGDHQGKSSVHLERKVTYELFHTTPNRTPPLLIAPAVLQSSPLPSWYSPMTAHNHDDRRR